MDETRNTLAFILERRPYREVDSLVTVYTQLFGKLNLIARGTKKLKSKLAGHIEPLTISEIMIVKGRGLDYIGSSINRRSYLNLRGNLNKLYYAGRAINLFNKFIKDGESDERLFFLLENWLAIIDASSDDFAKEKGELLFSFFALKFLDELGYKPEMHKCLLGSEDIAPGKNFFNLINGGLICSSCLEKNRASNSQNNLSILTISDNCIKIIRFIIKNDLISVYKLRVNKKIIKELYKLVSDYLLFCS